MKSILALIFAFALLPCKAQAVKTPPRLTGQQLVDMLATPPGVINSLQLNPGQLRKRKSAHSYIDGAHDASEGVAWCSNGNWKPSTIDEEVIWGLRALPPEKLKGSAAALVVEILREKLPCTP